MSLRGTMDSSVCRIATVFSAVACVLLASLALPGQTADWRRIGTATVARGLASPAGGPVTRVWFSGDGKTLYARTSDGSTWQTSDDEKWTPAPGDVQPPSAPATLVSHPLQKGREYRVDDFAWRSDDGGATWTNVSGLDGKSIIGPKLADIAVAPGNPDEVVAAGSAGVWRSVDGGTTWSGLNDGLPNFPVDRVFPATSGASSVSVLLRDGTQAFWKPGQRGAWEIVPDTIAAREQSLKSSVPFANVSTAVRSGDTVYAGTTDGRLLVSSDRGVSWRESPNVSGAGSILRIFSDARDPRFAVAIAASASRSGRVLRTVNGGGFWDDISSDLPSGEAHGVVADRVTGAVYVAADAGVFFTYTDAVSAGPATSWTRLRREAARDVALDAAGNQLFVGFETLGVWATMAPHRMRDPKVVSAGDRVLRAAAPGAVLSVLGARIQNARAGEQAAAVLVADETESQVQLPWDLNGSSVMVSMTSGNGGRIQVGLPLTPASPSIFLDRDGEPLITNADSGLVLDASTPARSNNRIQILASGLGRVTPVWPSGVPAPLQEPPKVDSPVRAWLDNEQIEVTRATLAPGYLGMYLIEVQLPSIVNRGTAELYIEAAGTQSNRVRIWLEP